MLLKPSDPKDDDNYVDEAQISQNRNEVDVNLLVGLQLIDVDP